MSIVWKFIKSMRWFFISAVIVFVIAFGLSHLSSHLANGGFIAFVNNYRFFWLFFRIVIVLIFIMCWPMMVDVWARKYDWPSAYIVEVKRRRWRYAVWFVIVDLAFQLL